MRALVNAVALAAASCLPWAGSAQTDALRQDISRARERVYPALVNITVVTRYFSEGRAQRSPSAGSGVIVTAAGHVLTNYHVAGRSTRITCVLPDGESIGASVLVHDPLTDLSVLKLTTEKRADPKKPLPFAVLGDSDALKVGDYVLAMGNPLMLSSSLTLGVVSNPKRVFTNDAGNDIEQMQLDEGETTGTFTRWIQHDAEIAPGNSGGPLVSLKGEVVGINELRMGGGIGFAIPSNIAKHVLEQALARGYVRRGWLGVTFLPVDNMGRTTGALVGDVLPVSAAAKAGVKPGDLIVALNDTPVSARFFEQVPVLYQRIAALEPGKPAKLRLIRDGKPLEVTATVAPMDKLKGDEEEFREAGATLEQITPAMAILQRLPVPKGVRVTGVRPGYPFEVAQPPIVPGDIIVSIGGQPTADLATFRKAVATIAQGERSVVLRRREEILVTSVKAKDDRDTDIDTELPKPWLGVKSQVVTAEVARALRLPKAGGFRITQVYDGTEAARAGLAPGDIITSLNGAEMKATRSQDADDLARAIENLSLGDKAKLGLLRGGKPAVVTVPLQPTPKSASKARTAKQKELEFVVRDITPMDRMESRRLRGVEGVLVSDVTMGGWAGMSGINVGDVVLAVNGAEIANVGAFEAEMGEILKKRPKTLTVFVQREFRTHFVFIEPDWAKLATSP